MDAGDQQAADGNYYSTITQQLPDTQLTRLQLTTSDILEDIEHQLKGEFYNEDKDIWTKKAERLIRTDEGIKDIIAHISPFVNRAIILSDLSDNEIYSWMEAMTTDIVFHLAKNAKKYTGNNTDKLDLVERIITHLIFATLKRAKNRGEGNLIGRATTRVESYGNEGGSVLSKLNPFGRR